MSEWWPWALAARLAAVEARLAALEPQAEDPAKAPGSEVSWVSPSGWSSSLDRPIDQPLSDASLGAR